MVNFWYKDWDLSKETKIKNLIFSKIKKHEK